MDYQLADVVFTKGLDTKTQQKLVIAGKWLQLTNVTLSDNQTPKRRDGMTALVASASGNGLAAHGDELLVVNGAAVSSVSQAAGTANLVGGRLGFVQARKTEIRRSVGMQDSLDCATGGGFNCYVWRDLSGAAVYQGLNCSLVDATTGTQLIANSILTTTVGAFCPRVVYASGAFFVLWIEGASLKCSVIQTSAPTVVGAAGALLTSASLASLAFDACAFGAAGEVMVVFGWADGVTSVLTAGVTQTAGVPSVSHGPTNLITEVQLPIANLCGLACARFSSNICGAFAFGFGATAMAGTAGATIAANWNVLTAATQLANNAPAVNAGCHIGATADSKQFIIFTDEQSSWATAALRPLTQITCTSALGASSAVSVIKSACFAGAATDPAGPKGPFIAGKPFVSGSSIFIPVCVMENYQGAAFTAPAGTRVTNNQQNTLFILDCTTGVGLVAAKVLYGAYGVAAVNNNAPAVSSPCSTPGLNTGGFLLACTERTLLSFVGGFNLSPSGVVALTLTPNTANAPIRAQLGESTYFAGGSLTTYDGANLSEASFALFPEGCSVEVVGGGGAMTAGVHQVVVIAEWVDNAGQRKQSAPSLATSATVAANDRLRVRVPSLLLSQMSGLNLVAFITQAGGLTFNRVGSISAGAAGTPNDRTQAFTTLALIDQADSVYASNELLYTQPNQAGTTLPNLGPGPSSVLAVHQNRVWFDKTDQQGQFGYSQPYVNNLGLQFNEQLGGTIDVGAGKIVGFCPLDEKMIIFCERRPFVVFGTGPGSSGANSSYSDPQPIQTDVGCSDSRSILSMPQGIIFKSLKGWYLLGRDLQVRYIGAGASQYDANTVTSAVLMDDRQECRFTLLSDPTSLVYSYEVSDADGDGQWSVNSFWDGGYSIADALWWPVTGTYVHVSTSFGLNRDTPGSYLDAPGGQVGTAIATTMQTSFLKMSVANFQRVRRLYLTGTAAHQPTSTLTIQVDYDDATAGPTTYVVTVATSTIAFPAGATQTLVDLRTKLHRQKCKSVSFTFMDQPLAADPGSGIEFQALALEVGMKRGVNKLPAAQSV